jgi:hypothetical protein
LQPYSQFLGWLRATGNLDPDAAPSAQMTRELWGEFVTARRKAVSDSTSYNNARSLTMMMNCLAPEHDWKWLWGHSATTALGGSGGAWEAAQISTRAPDASPHGRHGGSHDGFR